MYYFNNYMKHYSTLKIAHDSDAADVLTISFKNGNFRADTAATHSWSSLWMESAKESMNYWDHILNEAK